MLFLILVTCHSQFHLYLLIFSSTGSTFNFSRIFSFLLWSKRVYPAVLLKNFTSTDVNRFLFLFFFFCGSKFPFHIKEWGEPAHYILLFLKISGLHVVSKCSLEFPVFEQILLDFVAYLSHFHRELHNQDI